MTRDPTYGFRAVTEDDLSLLSRWLARPHVREWWGDPGTSIEEIKQSMEDDAVEPLIVDLDGTPIAYLQSYDPHMEEGHPYQDQPFGSLGIDITIGDPTLLGAGHGTSIIRAFTDILFDEGAPRVIIDPHPDNARAIRAYEKAGFEPIGLRTSIYGPALMMKRDAPEET